jgi:hypothetical protein
VVANMKMIRNTFSRSVVGFSRGPSTFRDAIRERVSAHAEIRDGPPLRGTRSRR